MDKQLFASSTVQSATALMLVVLTLIGVQLSEEEKLQITNLVVGLVAGLVSLASWIGVIRGRIKANPNLWFGGKKL